MKRNIRLLALFNFLSDFDFFSPVAILYFSAVSGSFTSGMSVFALIMFSSVIFEVPTGIFSDFWGRKKTILLGSLASLVAGLLIAFGQNYSYFLFSAIFAGIARAFYSGNNNALLYDSLATLGKHSQFHHYLGRLNAAFQLALALSAIVGGILANWSFLLVVWLAILPKIGMVVVSLFFKEPPHQKRTSTNVYVHVFEALKLVKNNKRLLLLCIRDALQFGIGESTYNFRATFIQTLWPIWGVGLASGISHFFGTVGFWFAGNVIKKMGTIRAMIMADFINRITGIGAVVFPTILSPLILTTTAFFYGINTTAKQTIFHQEFTDHQRSTLGSLTSLFGSILYSIFALLLGFVGDTLGPGKGLLLGQFCMILALVLIYFLPKNAHENTRY